MAKILAKSAEVLNEADRFQQMLDWELFTMEQETRLFYEIVEGVTWRPGDFLYIDPRWVGALCGHADCAWCNRDRWREGVMDFENSDYEGNCVRPMIQLLEDGELHRDYEAICKDCMVGWDQYSEDECWNCGKSFPRRDRMRAKSMGELMRGIYARQDAVREQIGWVNNIRELSPDEGFRMNAGFAETWRRANVAWVESMRSFSLEMNRFASQMNQFRAYVIVDELAPFYGDRWVSSPPAPFVPFRGRSFHNPWVEEPNPLRRPNIRGPMWGTAVLYDRLNQPVDDRDVLIEGSWINSQVRLPRRWRQMRPTIPMPQLLEPRDFSDWTPGVRNGPPTTLNRRPRNVGTR